MRWFVPLLIVLIGTAAAFDCSENKFVEAAAENKLDHVSSCLEEGVDVEATHSRNGLAALTAATMRGHNEVVKRLLSAGSNMEWTHADTGVTPLIAAASAGHLETVKLLFQHSKPPRINAADLEEGETALIAATRFNHSAVVDYLLSRKPPAEINRLNKVGQTALIIAAFHDYADVARTLLKYGPDIEARERRQNNALMVAASRGGFATVKVLMSGKVKPNTAASRPDGATPLVLACHSGHTKIVRYFLSLPEGLKPDVNFSPPVHNKPNAPTPLNIAAREGHTEIVRMLLAEKPTPRSDFVDSLGQSAICSASLAGHTEIVQMLLDSASPPSLEVTDDYMRTPLMGASMNGHFKIVGMLLQRRPNVPHKEMNDALEMVTDCAKRKLEKKHKNCEKGLELIWAHIQLTGKREL